MPEAQLDRFMMRISLGYPEGDDEITMLNNQQHTHPITGLEQVVSDEELIQAQKEIKEVYIDDLVKKYIVQLVKTTRKHPDVYLEPALEGASRCTKRVRPAPPCSAVILSRPTISQALAMETLSHRLIISPSARIKNVDPRTVIQEILDSTPVPGARVRAR